MASKIETVSKYLIKQYKEQKPDSGYVIVNHTNEYSLQMLMSMRNHARKYRMKTFHIKDIVPIDNDEVVSYHYGLAKAKRKNKITSQDKTGMFRIEFSDGDIIYYAKWLTGAGKHSSVEAMFASEEHTWYKFLKLIEKKRKRDGTPKKGVYRVTAQMGALSYSNMKSLQETPVVHHVTDSILEDMNYFYDNTHMFTRYGMPGVRKILLVGEPGTGKSSLCVRIANSLRDEKCVAFATDIGAAAAHLMKCARAKISTILFLEDAESSIGGGASSAVLNFLDGIDQPVNPAGAYVVMTTNFPQRIEPRILKRPGRVDRIFQFGALKSKEAVMCARIYFRGILFLDKDIDKMSMKERRKQKSLEKELAPILNNSDKGMTGAQIKELAQSSVSMAVSIKAKEVTVEIIKKTKERMEKDLKDVYEFAKEESLHGQQQQMGYVRVEPHPALLPELDDVPF